MVIDNDKNLKSTFELNDQNAATITITKKRITIQNICE